MGDGEQLWDEFQPTRFGLTIQMETDTGGIDYAYRRRVRFGIRTIAHTGRRVEVNGKRIFLRRAARRNQRWSRGP